MNQEAKERKELESSEKLRVIKEEKRDILDYAWKNEILLNWSNYWNPIAKNFRNIRGSEVINNKEK